MPNNISSNYTARYANSSNDRKDIAEKSKGRTDPYGGLVSGVNSAAQRANLGVSQEMA